MAGEEIASGYLSLGPRLAPNFKETLNQQLQPAAAAAGKEFGATTATATATGLSTAGPTMTKAGQDVGRSFVSGITTTVRTQVGPQITSTLGPSSRLVSSLKADLAGLGGKSLALGAVQQAASSAVGSLGGIASLVGYGGPLGVALAAGGIALGAYAQAQKNADQAAQDLLTTLNKETGALEAASLTEIVKKISADLSGTDLALLKSAGIDVGQGVAALAKGGSALDDYIAKVDAAKRTLKGNTAEVLTGVDAIDGYTSSLRNQANDLANTNSLWAKGKIEADAVASAAKLLGISLDSANTALATTNTALDSTAGSGVIASAVFGSIAAAAQNVMERIKAVPKDVTITAKSVGLDTLIGKLNAAIAAYVAMAAAASAANSIVADGERHGADLGSTSKANKVASQGGAAAAAAAAAAKAAVAAHNSAASAAQSKARAKADAKASAAEAKAAAAAQAKAAAIQQKRDALTTNLRGVLTQAQTTAIPNVTQLPRTGPGLVRALSKQLDTLKRFRSNLAILAKRGLPKVFLEQLIAAGLDGAATAAGLVTARSVDFNQIKKLTTQLQSQASALGGDEVKILYGTGVNAAKGLIAGLDSQQKAIEAQMTKIAKGMEKAIRKALGIKSPSTVMFGHGLNIAKGLELGTRAGTPAAHRAALGLVSVPRPVSAAGSLGAAAGGGGRPLVGQLVVNNPVGETTSGSVTRGLRQTTYLLGVGA